MKVYIDSLYMSSKGKSVVQYARKIDKYKTIPIAIQFLKQSHGQIDWGAMMAVLVLAILPIIIFYIVCQKYIIEGVLAGAVKG